MSSPTKATGHRPIPTVDELIAGVESGNRTWLSRAITMVESTRRDHRRLAEEMLIRLTPKTGSAKRIGITGTPGVGKSTFIDALGTMLTEQGHNVAVLAIDPSSKRTGGSILGDKTRMARLAVDPKAFIRPSPTSGTLGGVASATREAMVLVEAAGYDVVLVETVGVGQSETAVADMVDTFVVLLLARSGDSLQGIKKGVLELADVLAINKADGKHQTEAKLAARELQDALKLIGPSASGWLPPVKTCSALTETGLDELWEAISGHRTHLTEKGVFDHKRQAQQLRWMWATVEDRIVRLVKEHPDVIERIPDLEMALANGTTTPTSAANQILAASGIDTHQK